MLYRNLETFRVHANVSNFGAHGHLDIAGVRCMQLINLQEFQCLCNMGDFYKIVVSTAPSSG
jgi:hypothetical protein